MAKKDWANVAKPPNMKEKLKGVSLGKDDDGYFVYTHRCRSDSYESPEKIPKSKIRFIESTGSKKLPLSIRVAEESLRKIAEQKVTYRRTVKIHWSVYILVNALLFIINIFTAGVLTEGLILGRLWVLFPVMGWGIGVVMHSASYSMYANGVYPMAKRGVYYHAIAYIMVNLLLRYGMKTAKNFYWREIALEFAHCFTLYFRTAHFFLALR